MALGLLHGHLEVFDFPLDQGPVLGGSDSEQLRKNNSWLTLSEGIQKFWRAGGHLELGAVQLQQPLSVDIPGCELRDVMLQVDAHEPASHLLRGPVPDAQVLQQVLFGDVSLLQNLKNRPRTGPK